jgi:putative transposase
MGRVKRGFHKPSEDESRVFLHVYNHCVENSKDEFPLGDVEKEYFFKLLKRLLKLYTIECISAVCMSNHYHLCLVSSLEKLSPAEMALRVNRQRSKLAIPVDEHDALVISRAEQSNDISHFMKEFQRLYTHWYNKTRSFTRRGTLWEQRFKSQKLLGDEAVVTCLQYIELNPVRAGICENPAEYRFSTYGRWQQSGKHMFCTSFLKYMCGLLGVYLESKDLKGIERYFRGRYAGICAQNSRDMSEVDNAVLRAKKGPSLDEVLLRRSRFYIDSLVIGSRLALKEQAAKLWGEERVEKKRFGRLMKGDDTLLGLRSLGWHF